MALWSWFKVYFGFDERFLMNNELIELTKDLLVRHEGIKLMPYKDSLGYWTIGIGRCLDKTGIWPEEKGKVPDSMIDGISEEQAFLMLYNDMRRCYTQLVENVDFFASAPIMIQAVLMDMCFNLGIKGLLGFKNTLRYLKDEEYIKAADEMLESLWAKQVGFRAVHLASIVKFLGQ